MKDFLKVITLLLIASCGGKSISKSPDPPQPQPPQNTTTYTNPVFKPILADPTVIKDSASEYFYAYGTEDYWTTDKNGTDWMLYHAMDVNNAQINGVSQRALMLDKINWSADGWPTVNEGTPSSTKQAKPVFN